MTDALQTSGHFIVLGDPQMRQEALNEQDFVASGRTAKGKKAPKTGRMTPAQLLVKGEITHVQSSTTGGKGGVSFKGISLGGSKDAAEINATIYLVDSETGQVKASQEGQCRKGNGACGGAGGPVSDRPARGHRLGRFDRPRQTWQGCHEPRHA
jgi:curli biogenesis system outer membrane secretion channel CsgG